MQGTIVVLGAIATPILILNVRATVIIARQIDVPRRQRRSQVIFTWLLPVVGALIALEIHRRARPYSARARLAADEINPVVEQALRPQADAATQTSARFIEQQAIDFAEHSGHSHSDGSH
jgi:hypothetical protein